MRQAMLQIHDFGLSEFAFLAEAESTVAIKDEIAAQTLRHADAVAKLSSPKPTKKAENDLRVPTNKIPAELKKLEDMASPAGSR